jgi:diphthine-ammonia ligase
LKHKNLYEYSSKYAFMRLGVLFSGGKDSAYAMYKAMETEQIVCLISVISQNEYSYMFHTPNITLTGMQAEAMELPLIQESTAGAKEEELKDLEKAIKKAKDTSDIEGIVTGAVESVYQAERVQRLCNDLDLWCFNPLWLKNQEELLREIIQANFNVIISGVFAYPLDVTWLGKRIDTEVITRLSELKKEYKISPSGEGGEIETTVLDAPFFKKSIRIVDYEKKADKNSGFFIIRKAQLVEK